MAKLSSRILEALDRVTGGLLSTQFRAAATTADDDPRATEYRKLSATTRDLLPMTYDKQRELSFYLWQRNPVARRMIDIVVQFCTGDEFAVNVKIKRKLKDGKEEDTKRDDAQSIWEKFANHPVNNFYGDLSMFLQDLLIFGELAMPTNVRLKDEGDGTFSGDGSVLLGYYDPGAIKRVITDPRNVRVAKAVELSQGNSAETITETVVQMDLDPNSTTFERMVGQVLLYRINRVVNQTRGTGILIEELDWLDLLDQFLFDALKGFQVRNTFMWSVLMKGLTEQQITDMQSKFQPPQTGAARIHNESVEYTTIAPDLKSQDIATALLSIQTFIVGAKGFPIMWFGTGENSNRAVASEMAIPTMRMLKAMQKIVKAFIKSVMTYVLDQAIIGQQLSLGKDEVLDIEISMYDFERKDASVIAAGVQQLVAAMTIAVENGWMSDETAKKVMDGLLMRLGVEVDTEETVEYLQAKQDEKKQNSPYNVNTPPPGGDQANMPPGNGKGKKQAPAFMKNAEG